MACDFHDNNLQPLVEGLQAAFMPAWTPLSEWLRVKAAVMLGGVRPWELSWQFENALQNEFS